MKPMTSTVINKGTIEGASSAMTIDAENMEHLMAVLANLYGDPITAVIREYATNAYDAHKEAGIDLPIKITLPSKLSPTLVIEDFGVGMTHDELLGLYSQYGSSTKRDTNEQTGMLGIGSKSALAVTSQFTVRSRKGGVETTALIFLNDRGSGEIKVVDTKATDKTGTQIKIPVPAKDIRSYQDKAAYLFSFWTPGTFEGVEVLSYGPRTDLGDGIIMLEGGSIARNSGGYRYSQSIVFVQGNVPYRYDSDKANDHLNNVIDSLPSNRDFIFYCPIGSLQFTPAREDLYYTAHTMREIENAVMRYRKGITTFLETKLDSQPDKKEAIRFCEKWAEFTKGMGLLYKGEIVPSSVEAICFAAQNVKHDIPTKTTTLPSVTQLEKYDAVVYDIPEGKISGTGYLARNAISRYFGYNGLAERYSYQGTNIPKKRVLFILGDLPKNWDWYGITAIKWDDFDGKMPVAKGLAQAGTEYANRLWDDANQWGKKVKIAHPEGEGVIWIDYNEHLGNIVPAVNSRFQFLRIKGNQVDRFQREFPKALSMEQARDLFYKEMAHLDIPSLAHGGRKVGKITSKDLTNCLDKNLVDVVNYLEKATRDLVVWRKEASKYGRFEPFSKATVDKAWEDKIVKVTTTYGDILELHPLNAKRKIEIVNALYSYKRKGGSK